MILKKLPHGFWRVESNHGKNMGTFDSKEKALKRMDQIDAFNNKFRKRWFWRKKAMILLI